MKKSYKKVVNSIYIDKDLIIKTKDTKRFNVILSPYFYWAKVEDELPIKKEAEVKKLAPSLFEGMLPMGDFIYKVFKLAEAKYLLIALDKKFILSEFSKLNIDKNQIENIYLAQSEFINISNPIEIDDKNGLINIDGVIEKAPLKYIKGYSTPVKTILSSISFSKHKMGLYELEDNFIDNKSFYLIVGVLVLIASINLTEYFLYKKELKEVVSKRDELLSKHDLPTTSFELESIKSSLNLTQKEQLKIRQKLAYLNKITLANGEYLYNLELKNNNLNLSIKLNDPKRAEEMKAYLIKEFKIKNMRVKDDVLFIEMEL